MLMTLALSLSLMEPGLEGGPAARAAWKAVEGTYQSWVQCVVGGARARAAEAMAPETIGEEAVAACGAQEAAWRAASGAWRGTEHDSEPMAAQARCQMVRRGAKTAIVYRPIGVTRVASRLAELERRCRDLLPASGEAVH